MAEKGLTPLHYACMTGCVKSVRGLLKAGADVNAVDMYGRQPIHRATIRGHVKVVKALVRVEGIELVTACQEVRSPSQKSFEPYTVLS